MESIPGLLKRLQIRALESARPNISPFVKTFSKKCQAFVVKSSGNFCSVFRSNRIRIYMKSWIRISTTIYCYTIVIQEPRPKCFVPCQVFHKPTEGSGGVCVYVRTKRMQNSVFNLPEARNHCPMPDCQGGFNHAFLIHVSSALPMVHGHCRITA